MTSPLSPEAVAQMVADRDDVFLIMKRDLYYRPNAQGYTGIKEHAGRYTLEQVAAMFPNMDSPHQDGTEFIRECDAPEYTKACYHDLKEAHQAERLTALAAENAALRAEFELLTAVKDAHKMRGDNHWETLRSIRVLAQEGKLDHIIQHVNDAGAGYTQPDHVTMWELQSALAVANDRIATLRASEAAAMEALAEIGAVVTAIEGADSLDKEIIRNIRTRIAALTPTADKEPKT